MTELDRLIGSPSREPALAAKEDTDAAFAKHRDELRTAIATARQKEQS